MYKDMKNIINFIKDVRKMKKISKIKYALIAWIVAVITYSAIVFIIADHTKRGIDKCIIITYSIMMIDLVIVLISWIIGNRKMVAGAIDAVNPISSLALYLTTPVFVITTVLYFINYQKFIFLVVVIFIFLFGLFAVLAIVSMRQFELVNENPNKLPELTNIHQLASYLRNIFDMVTEPTTKNQIEELIKLATVIDELDDKDSEDIIAVEKSIFEYAGYLKRNISRSEYSNVTNNIEKIKTLLNKRIDLVK